MTPRRTCRLLLAFTPILLAGCATTTPPSSTPRAVLSGVVHGGQQPVAGATIQLYAVGTVSDGSAATPLLTTAVLTDAAGTFNITSDYTCPSASTQVYLVATGGDPSPAIPNPQLALMTALGSCGNYSASSFISVNELTTVASVYALAPYMTSYSAVGSGPTDATALASAFTLASQLVNIGSGTTPGVDVPYGLTVPIAQIDTIANIVAACINSPGGTSGDTSACGQFFALTLPSGGTPSTDTISALLDLAQNPALNTQSLYNLPTPASPFQPTDPTQPADFSIDLTPTATSALTFSTPQLYVPSGGSSFITLTNSGETSISLSSFATSTGFSQSNNCPADLALSAFCTVTVSAATTTQTPFSGTLTVTTSASATAQVINLVTAQYVHDFSSADLNTETSGYFTYNDFCYDGGPYYNSSYCGTEPSLGGTDPGDFLSSGYCLVRIPNSCSTTVNFTPTALGFRFATFSDPNAIFIDQTHTYLMVGYGLPANTASAAAFSLSTTSVTLAAEPPGTPSPAQTITLSNTGNVPLSVQVGPYSSNASDFTYSAETCGVEIPITGICTITVNGTPPGAGLISTSLPVTVSAYPGFDLSSSINVSITGTAPSSNTLTASATQLYVSPYPDAGVTFLDLTNSSSAPIVIGSISTTTGFSQTNNCTGSLAVGATCVVTLSAAAPSATEVDGTLTIVSSVQTQSVNLVTGFSYFLANFGNVAIGTPTPPSIAFPCNPFAGGCNITATVSGAGFGGGGTCAVGQGAPPCDIYATFSPTIPGYSFGQLLQDSTESNLLIGFGVPANSSNAITAMPSSLTFPATALNAVSASQTITVSNPAGHLLNLAIDGHNAYANTPQFTVSPATCAALSCTVSVAYAPTVATFSATASLLVYDSVTNAYLTPEPTLSGLTSTQPFTLTPTELDFGTIAVGSVSTGKTITIAPVGNSQVTVGFSFPSGPTNGRFGSDFTASSFTLFSSNYDGLATSQPIYFTPTGTGNRNATMTVSVGGQVIGTYLLTGTGTPAPAGLITLSTYSLAFTGTNTQPIVVTNHGTGTFQIASIAVTGGFSETDTCHDGVPAGGSCTITVIGASSAGASGTLTLNDGDTADYQAVTLTSSAGTDNIVLSTSTLAFLSPSIQSFTAKNLGYTAAAVSVTVPAGYTETDNCAPSLAAQSTCTVNVTVPNWTGPTLSSALTVVDADTTGNQTVTLTYPPVYAVGEVIGGSQDYDFATFTVFNGSITASLTGSSYYSFNDGYSACSIPEGTCEIVLNFEDSDTIGPVYSLLSYSINSGSTQNFILYTQSIASGVQAYFTDRVALGAAITAHATTANSISISLANLGTSTLSVPGLSAFTSYSPTAFPTSTTCPTILAPNSSGCTVTFTYTQPNVGPDQIHVGYTDPTSGVTFDTYAYINVVTP